MLNRVALMALAVENHRRDADQDIPDPAGELPGGDGEREVGAGDHGPLVRHAERDERDEDVGKRRNGNGDVDRFSDRRNRVSDALLVVKEELPPFERHERDCGRENGCIRLFQCPFDPEFELAVGVAVPDAEDDEQQDDEEFEGDEEVLHHAGFVDAEEVDADETDDDEEGQDGP
ncbi:hypothetical protein A4G99_18680 [Haladaptatus sp. R4]|nr:hypothetical protein A4G99_18680 [Haladaptatus sp. R4]